ncbi:hypothetical protein Mapa_018910 [Marchantia paleacea]|nr:hypothetical protein Mapa_018910 [Marchantia paleacea]
MTFHLSTKNSRWFYTSNHVPNFCMIIGNKYFITKILNLFSKPFFIMFTISSSTTNTNSHLTSKNFCN